MRAGSDFVAGSRPSARTRVAVALLVAAFTVLIVIHDVTAAPGVRTDFDQHWFAARAILAGRNPYLLIGPGREFDWVFQYFYPLTTAVAVIPLAVLPLVVARALLLAASAGLLSWLITRDHWWKLTIFASGAFIDAIKWAQWSPLLACTLLTPALGFLTAIKPNFGVILVASMRSAKAAVQAILGGALLVGISLVVQPAWPRSWLSIFGTRSAFVSLVQYPEGAFLLLALLRWRRADARLLLAMSILPFTPVPHSILFLLLIPRSPVVLMLLGIVTNAMLLIPEASGPVTEESRFLGRLILWSVAFPLLAVVLRRPNVGPAFAFLERWLERAPRWMRGKPGPSWDPVAP